MTLPQTSMVTLRPCSTRLMARIWGAGDESVLCLHATGHSGADFGAMAERIAPRFRVIALDWPGQGGSPPDGCAPRAQHYASLTLRACEALGLVRPIVIGNSIGGAAAIIAAAHAPQQFAGLVLCNPGGLAPVDAPARLAIAAMAAFFDAGARGAAWYPAAFRAYYRHVVLPAGPARARRGEIIAEATALAPLLADAWRGFGEPQADLRALAARLGVPVWCAWAKSDPLVAWGRSKAAVRTIPDVDWTLLRGGHAAFLEDPDRFAAQFLARTAPAGGPSAPPGGTWRLTRA